MGDKIQKMSEDAVSNAIDLVGVEIDERLAEEKTKMNDKTNQLRRRSAP